MNYSNQNYRSARYSFNRKRQIIDAVCNELHQLQMEMIEQAVAKKQVENFPEANQIINYIKTL